MEPPDTSSKKMFRQSSVRSVPCSRAHTLNEPFSCPDLDCAGSWSAGLHTCGAKRLLVRCSLRQLLRH